VTENERRYRTAFKHWLWLFILYVPVVYLIAVGLYRVFGTFVPGFFVAGLWMVAWFLAAIRAAMLRYRWKHSE